MNTVHNTPILEHFKCLALPVPEHFNQSVMLSSSRRLNVFTLKASLGILCQYHDMLRAVWDGQQLKVRDVTAGNQFHLEENLECEPLMTFNYLGSFEESGSDGIFTFDNTLPQGSSVSSENRSDTPLSINCAMVDGKLSGTLSYNKGVLDEDLACKLCEAYITQLKLLNE